MSATSAVSIAAENPPPRSPRRRWPAPAPGRRSPHRPHQCRPWEATRSRIRSSLSVGQQTVLHDGDAGRRSGLPCRRRIIPVSRTTCTTPRSATPGSLPRLGRSSSSISIARQGCPASDDRDRRRRAPPVFEELASTASPSPSSRTSPASDAHLQPPPRRRRLVPPGSNVRARVPRAAVATPRRAASRRMPPRQGGPEPASTAPQPENLISVHPSPSAPGSPEPPPRDVPVLSNATARIVPSASRCRAPLTRIPSRWRA